MKKNKLIILVIMVAVTIIIVSLLLSVSSNKEKTAPNQNINHSSSTTSIQPIYILKEYNGNIAVYRYGETQPIDILSEIVYYSLPKYDREQLKKGIYIYSEAELQRLIEDFDG